MKQIIHISYKEKQSLILPVNTNFLRVGIKNNTPNLVVYLLDSMDFGYYLIEVHPAQMNNPPNNSENFIGSFKNILGKSYNVFCYHNDIKALKHFELNRIDKKIIAMSPILNLNLNQINNIQKTYSQTKCKKYTILKLLRKLLKSLLEK